MRGTTPGGCSSVRGVPPASRLRLPGGEKPSAGASRYRGASMSRRHETLVPLTHDHHHALAQAKRLAEVASSGDDRARVAAAGDFVNFYLGRALRHFHEEEELFFAPVVDHPAARDLVLRAVTEHLRMHALVRQVRRGLTGGRVDGALLKEISDLLAEHVRFEERELLPLVERLVPEEELRDLAAARRDV